MLQLVSPLPSWLQQQEFVFIHKQKKKVFIYFMGIPFIYN
jgi:hypothetical protein